MGQRELKSLDLEFDRGKKVSIKSIDDLKLLGLTSEPAALKSSDHSVG